MGQVLIERARRVRRRTMHSHRLFRPPLPPLVTPAALQDHDEQDVLLRFCRAIGP